MTNLHPISPEKAARLLVQIHDEFGCQWNVQNEATGFYQEPKAKAVAKPKVVEKIVQPPAISAEDEAILGAIEAVKQAETLASQATDLATLRASLESFNGCESLSKTAENLVFSDGVEGSQIMVIGEAPEAEEDREGKPFVGASGQLLNRMLSHIGLDREKNFYITNMVFWRPPGNRDPLESERNICAPFVKRHIELVSPKVLLLVGNIPMKHFFATSDGITKMRGSWAEYQMGDVSVPMLATFHPAYLLRNPMAKRDVWADLRTFRQRLDELGISV